MTLCKHCRAKLPLSQVRVGFCKPNKKTGQNCQLAYAREHGHPDPLPRLFDAPEPPRPKRVINPAKAALNRRHGRDNRE